MKRNYKCCATNGHDDCPLRFDCWMYAKWVHYPTLDLSEVFTPMPYNKHSGSCSNFIPIFEEKD
jgi:hypothetical protein